VSRENFLYKFPACSKVEKKMGLIKVPGSPFWFAQYTETDGKRRRISTKTKNKRAAQAFLDDVQARVRNQKAGVWRPEPKPITFGELVQLYLKRKTKSSLNKDEQRARLHLVPFFGAETKLSALTSGHVEELKPHLRSEASLSAATVNRCLALLSHMLRLAVEWGYLRESPYRAKKLRETQRTRLLSPDEKKRLIKASGEPLRQFVVVALSTGARGGELLKLEWKDVDLERKTVTFVGTKNGRTRTIPLNSAATKALQSLPRGGGDERVFSRKSLRGALEGACNRAGLPTKGKDKVTMHTLRHTGLSDLARAGAPISVLREVGGHQSLAMLSRYLHPSHQREAVEKLSDELGAF
jgi:integrase